MGRLDGLLCYQTSLGVTKGQGLSFFISANYPPIPSHPSTVSSSPLFYPAVVLSSHPLHARARAHTHTLPCPSMKLSHLTQVKLQLSKKINLQANSHKLTFFLAANCCGIWHHSWAVCDLGSVFQGYLYH